MATDGRRGGWRKGCAITAAVGLGLIVLAIVVGCLYDRMWERRLEAKLQESRGAGQPATWEEVLAAWPQIPPEGNAALVLLDALELLPERWTSADELLQSVIPVGEDLGRRYSPPTLTLARSRLDVHAPALDLVHEAARLDAAAYPVDPQAAPVDRLFPDLRPLRDTARLLCMKAVCSAQAGEAAAAAAVLLDCAALPASLEAGASLIETLVRIAMDAYWANAIEQALGLCELAAADLAALREAIMREDEGLSLEGALIGERAGQYEAMRRLFAEDELRGQWGGDARTLRVLSVLPGWPERNMLFSYETFTEALRIEQMPIASRHSEAQGLEAHLEHAFVESPKQLFLSAMYMPALGRAIEESVRGHAFLRVTVAVLAVEEWRLARGGWPESLAVLAPGILDAVPEDPFTGEPLRYRQRDDGVVVYSVGPDGRDDAGTTQAEAAAAAGSYTDEGWDIAFRLLDPERRGARTATFRDEVLAADGVSLQDLAEAGFPEERLLELGLTEDDLAKLR